MEQAVNQNQNARWKRDFLVIASGQTVSLVGSSAVQFALIWWLTSETGSALMLSLAGLLAFLPNFILGPFAGVWVDRLKRKAVIIGADLFIALAAGIFALLFLFGTPPYWTACVILGVRAVGSVFHTPAIQAAVPMLVPPDQLMRANGWSQFMQSGAFILGPVLGAALYAAFPLPVVMLTDVLGAAMACVTVAAVKIPEIRREKRSAPNIFREMKEGAAVLLKDKPLCMLTLASVLCMIFYMPLSSLYPLMNAVHFRGTEWHAGVVNLAYSAGMMLCSLAVSAYGEIKHKFRAVHAAFICFGVFTLVSGLLPADLSYFSVFALLCALMGAAANFSNIPYMTYLQQTIPPEVQGRVFSFIMTLMSLAMPVGLAAAGPIAEAYGVTVWFIVTGIAMIAIMILSSVLTSIKKKF
ncbi:MAG: enterobactin exporter EntS [Firmicutes bacterium ADurb.Bin182]|nr:MAG: enterobactin exporter EntS [Firmicutes bacterium ADurb.Bin182]